MTARRVRVAGDLYHGQVPAGAVYVGRAAPGLPASPYANPYRASRYSRDEALRLYRDHLAARPELVAQAHAEIGDRAVACWCRTWEPCHGDVLLAAIAAAAAGEPAARPAPRRTRRPQLPSPDNQPTLF